jgi:asparagine synthase (glutamine-hydrolysing)
MCGICGILGPEDPSRREAAVLRMMNSMIHRGPDDHGQLSVPGATIGMRRLSIIDLAGGAQPVWNEARTLAVMLNGEIVNFRELRAELESLGHTFRARSDTEAVVHAFESWGIAAFERLRGMFALAILDLPHGLAAPPRRLLLARDPLGIKPLYYSQHAQTLLFASEVRALLTSGLLDPQLSPDSLVSYFLFGSVAEPSTLIEGIQSLPPGHYLELIPQSPHPEPRLFWRFASPDKAPPRASSATASGAQSSSSSDPVRAVRAALEDAVSSYLISDVPVGVFLSSGLDSSAIAALATRLHPGIVTLTVGFPEKQFSEEKQACRTASLIGSTHHEILISGDEMVSHLEAALSSFDQPSMDGVNTWFVSRAARQAGLKVALSGLGGDELFGGYPSFVRTPRLRRIASSMRALPGPLRSISAIAIKTLAGKSRADAIRKFASSWRSGARGLLPHAFFYTRALFTPDAALQFLRGASSLPPQAPWLAWLADAASAASRMDDFAAVSWLEMRSYMLSTLLRDTDSMSMAHSLEVRVPLLDIPLVESVLSLTESQKRPIPTPKALLVEAVRDLLPPELLAQPKRTFTLPWSEWLRGPLRERVAASLSKLAPPLAAVLDSSRVIRVWKDFLASRTSWSRPWSLFVLNEWVHAHFSAPVFREPPR